MRRARRTTVLSVLALSALALLSATVPDRSLLLATAAAMQTARVTNMERGDGEEVDLFTLAHDLVDYEGKLVWTRGRFEPLLEFDRNHRSEPIYVLKTRASLLAVPAYGMAFVDLEALIDSDVRVRGVIRALSPGRAVFDFRQYPDLPPVPDPRPGLPRVSITMLAISHSGAPGPDQGLEQARRVLAEPERYAGRPVEILGRFRGHNLFGDLPPASQRNDSDWVIKAGDVAVWVRGKPPRGEGFSLDPSHPGDTSKWLAVTGRAQVVNGILYLRATSVLLTSPPAKP